MVGGVGDQRGRRFIGRSILDARGVIVCAASSSQKDGIEAHEPMPSSSILDWEPDPPHCLTRGGPWSLHSQPATTSTLAESTLFEEGGIETTDYIIICCVNG